MSIGKSVISMAALSLALLAFSQDTFARGPDIEMIFVKGGRFRMGCQSASDPCIDDERPIHEAQLNDFYIGKYPVTQAQWVAVMGTNPSYFTGDENRPVEQVSWNDIQEFIAKLNEMTGKRYRLPTEAEWEFAARGGTLANRRVRPPRPPRNAPVNTDPEGYADSEWMSDIDTEPPKIFWGMYPFLDDVAWYSYNSGGTTHPVGQKGANQLGMHDVIGNVWEWVSDRYDRFYYRNAPLKNPRGPRFGNEHVYRGNSFISEERHCRLSIRNYANPNHRGIDVGFRLARNP